MGDDNNNEIQILFHKLIDASTKQAILYKITWEIVELSKIQKIGNQMHDTISNIQVRNLIFLQINSFPKTMGPTDGPHRWAPPIIIIFVLPP